MKTADTENRSSENVIDNEGFQCLSKGLIGVFTMIFLGLLIEFIGLPMVIFYIILGVGFVSWIGYMIHCFRS